MCHFGEHPIYIEHDTDIYPVPKACPSGVPSKFVIFSVTTIIILQLQHIQIQNIINRWQEYLTSFLSFVFNIWLVGLVCDFLFLWMQIMFFYSTEK